MECPEDKPCRVLDEGVDTRLITFADTSKQADRGRQQRTESDAKWCLRPK